MIILFLPFDSLHAQDHAKYSKKIAPWVDFLKEQKTSGIDYIFQLFEKYDLVVICERMHPEYTQYDFFYEIVTDPRFAEIGGKLYTENYSMAGTKMFERLNYSEDQIAVKQVIDSIVFNTGFWPFESNRNMHDFLTKLYYFNREKPAGQRIEWMGTDDELLNWYKIHTPEDIEQKWEKLYGAKRDEIMAKNIHSDFTGKNRKKALIIMNYRHSFMNDGWRKDGKLLGYSPSMARYLDKASGLSGRVANVWLNEINSPGNPFPYLPVAKGKLDAAFKVLGTPPLGFDMEGSPLGDLFFELWPKRYTRHNQTFKDLFHGFVFYNPVEEHRCYQYFPEYYSILENREEYIRRMKLIKNKTDAGKVSVKFLDKKIISEPYPRQRAAQRKINRWIKKL